MDVPVEINKRVFDYDQLIIIGPVFPHEVVGFSGGNKYLVPRRGRAADFEFLPLARRRGHEPDDHRQQMDARPPRRGSRGRDGATSPKLCLAMVVRPDKSLAGLFTGTPEAAWDAASELSKQVHIVYKDRPFHTVLSVLPKMYDELWVGGKGMYKLEPVVADGGELIIYAPHITEVCVAHGKTIKEIGYHCRDYFLKQWDKFKHHPWGVLAHSTHVRGIGTFENGVEKCRVKVTLATGIPREICERINLGYRDPSDDES